MSVPLHAGPKPSASVAVFEHRSWWAAELQRQFRNGPVAVRGCRSAADALQADVAVLQLDAAPNEVALALYGRMAVGGKQGVVVVAAPELTALEPAIRELGADAFAEEPMAGEDMARLCRRLLEKVREQTWLKRV